MQILPTPTRRSSPQKRAQIPTSNSLLQNPALGVQLYPLRCARIHPGPSPHPPCSPQIAVWLLCQIASTTPCSVHSPLPATSADGCTLHGDAPRLKLLPRRSISAL